jgi:hypothetical protein
MPIQHHGCELWRCRAAKSTAQVFAGSRDDRPTGNSAVSLYLDQTHRDEITVPATEATRGGRRTRPG